MAPSILQLIKLIGEEISIFESFLQLLNRQQEALVANDVESVEEITVQLEKLAGRTRSAEEQRRKLVKDVSCDLQLNQDDVNLSQLTKLVSGPESDQLGKLQATLLKLHDQISTTKERNDFLIKKSMEYLNETITYLSGATRQDATYPMGENKLRKSSRTIMLDRRM